MRAKLVSDLFWFDYEALYIFYVVWSPVTSSRFTNSKSFFNIKINGYEWDEHAINSVRRMVLPSYFSKECFQTSNYSEEIR